MIYSNIIEHLLLWSEELSLHVIINHIMVLTSPDISHETGGPKSNRQEPVGSMYDFPTLVTKETCQK